MANLPQNLELLFDNFKETLFTDGPETGARVISSADTAKQT